MTTIQEQLDAALAENARLKAPKALVLKVGEKGGISLYGLGRFPVTLYKEQWDRLLAFAATGEVQKFMADNIKELKLKEE